MPSRYVVDHRLRDVYPVVAWTFTLCGATWAQDGAPPEGPPGGEISENPPSGVGGGKDHLHKGKAFLKQAVKSFSKFKHHRARR